MKNKIMKMLACIAFVIFIISVCMIDSVSIMPFIAAIACSAYLMLFVCKWVN